MNNSPTDSVISDLSTILHWRERTLLRGLQFEIRTGGKMTRGASCYTIIKKQYGFKGNKANVLAQFISCLEQEAKNAESDSRP